MRKKHAIFLLCILLLRFGNTYGQSENDDLQKVNSDYKLNSVYFELGGNGLFYSFGYDRLFKISNISKFSLGSGLTYSYSGDSGGFWVSPQINYLIGSNHNFEIGIGITIPIILESNIDLYPLCLIYRIGYRYQKEEGGLLFRIGFTPFSVLSTRGLIVQPIIPWAGIAIGWTF